MIDYNFGWHDVSQDGWIGHNNIFSVIRHRIAKHYLSLRGGVLSSKYYKTLKSHSLLGKHDVYILKERPSY